MRYFDWRITLLLLLSTGQVAELTEFTKQWTKEAGSDQSTLDAFRLLSQKSFDAKKLFEDVNAIQMKVSAVNSTYNFFCHVLMCATTCAQTSDDSAMRLEGTDIEGYLAHQHDMIILTAIEEAKQGAEDHVQEMQRRCVTGTDCHPILACFGRQCHLRNPSTS